MHAAQALAATKAAVQARYVGDSDRAYYDLLCELWAAGDSFILVEHDIAVGPATLHELAWCDNDWCACPFDYGQYGLTYGLGCVKFSAELIARNPTALIKVGVMSDPSHPRRHWCRLDAWLQGVVLPNAGEQMCRHDTPVLHLGAGNSHGCAV